MTTFLEKARLGLLALVMMLVLFIGTLSPITVQGQAEQTQEASQPEATEIPVIPTEVPPTLTPIPTEIIPEEKPAPTAEVTESPTAEITAEATDVVLTPTLDPTAVEPGLSLLYSENFASGAANEWSLTSGWTFLPSEADYALRGVGSAIAQLNRYDNLLDVAVQTRFMLAGGAVKISARQSVIGSYTIEVAADGTVTLYRAEVLLQTAAVAPVIAGEWHTLQLSAIENTISVVVDNVVVMTATDATPLPPGKVALSGNAEASTLLDDVQIFIPADQPIPPTAVFTPAAPTPEITPEPTQAVTPEVTPEATLETTPEVTPEVAEEVLGAPLAAAVPVGATMTFEVNTKSDTNDGVCNATHCSLREAITAANANPGLDTVTFNIVAEAPPLTIYPLGCKLPDITDPIFIDGYTQPQALPATDSAVAVIKIGIAGNSAGGPNTVDCPTKPDGLKILAGGSGSTIRGLSINGFTLTGIHLSGTSNVTVSGNFIGLTVDGDESGNLTDGIYLINSDNNVIGGTTPADRNVISGNQNDGIEIDDGSDNTSIQGNYIGLDSGGLFAIGNSAYGINTALPALIGGTRPLENGTACKGPCNVISGNILSGIVLFDQGANFSVIQGNYIGTNKNGTTRVPNKVHGVYVYGSGGNLIGGTVNTSPGFGCTGACNLITGNTQAGIEIAPKTFAVTDNVIIGNYIGTNPAGTGVVTTANITGNAVAGIRVSGVAQAIIGSTVSAARNVISGNQGDGSTRVPGILIIGSSATNVQVYSNYIGTNSAGNAALPNGLGIQIKSPDAKIGNIKMPAQTGTPEYRNIISGNLDAGIEIDGTGLLEAANPQNIRIRDNFIGVSADGMVAIPNGGDGVRIISARTNFIGEDLLTVSNGGNVISGNLGNGIKITGSYSTSIRILRNLIGVNANNTAAIGNGLNGVLITGGAARTQIGLDYDDDPTTALIFNTIANNGAAGIAVDSTAGNGNSARNNVIKNNAGLGIDLAATGVNRNDIHDTDTGPNNLQNFPILTNVSRTGGSVIIQAALDSSPQRHFRVDFFANSAATCDPSGYGEGPSYLGSHEFDSDINGQANFEKIFPDTLFDQFGADFFTMTVTDFDYTQTDPYYNVSEFSRCIDRNNNPPTISDIPDQTTRGSIPIYNIPFTVSDVETPAADLQVSALSSNTDAVPLSGITFGGSGQNRTVTIRANKGLNDTNLTITIKVMDAAGGFDWDTFNLHITPNTAPTLANIANTSTTFGTAKTIALTVGDTDDSPNILEMSGWSENLAVVTNDHIVFGGSGTARTVTITPTAGMAGAAVINIQVSDGDRATVKKFTLTVNANTAPSISAIANQIGVSNTPKEISFTVADTTSPVESITVTAASNNIAVLPASNITFSGTGASRKAVLSPVLNQITTTPVTVTFTASDGYMSSNPVSFSYTVNLNRAPTITAIADTTMEAGATKKITATIADADVSAGWAANSVMQVSAISLNQTILPNNRITVTAPGAGGWNKPEITVTPVKSGSVTVRVMVSDGDKSVTDEFVITASPGSNTPPTIENVPNQSTYMNVPLDIRFTVSDAETPLDQISVTAVATTNGTLIGGFGIPIVGATPGERILTITPAAGKTGTATITLTAEDALGLKTSDTFQLEIKPNTKPTISNITDQTTSEGVAIQNLPFTVGDLEFAADTLVLSAASNNELVIPNSGITWGGSGSNRTISLTPLPGQTGQATITVTVTDRSGDTQVDVFTVTVKANAAPTITDIPSKFTTKNLATRPILFTVTDGETPNSLTTTATSSDQNIVPNANIVINPNTGTNRALIITPLTDVTGQVTITVTVTDPKGLSDTTQFLLTITENNPPTISLIAPQFGAPSTAIGPISFTVSDPETAAEELVVEGVSSATTLVPNTNIVVGGAGAERTVTIYPLTGQTGTTTITLTVSDAGGSYESVSFLLTIQAMPPTPNLPANLSTVATVKPAFSWTAVPGAKQYKLQVDDSANFDTPLEIDKPVTSTSFTATDPLIQNRYYWRVKALNAVGSDLSSWSTTPSFTVSLLKAPVNRSYTTTTKPVLSWAAVTGANYQLELGSTPPGTPGFQNLFSCVTATTSCTPTEALAPGLYYWRVNVTGIESQVIWQFTVTTPPPVAPKPQEPAANAYLSDSMPTLRWSAVPDALGNSSSYEVQVDNSRLLDTPEFSRAGIIGANPNIQIQPELPDGIYYWRVRTINSLGVPGAWSAIYTFTIDTLKPPTPLLATPTAGAITNVTRPVLTWKAATGASSYRVAIAFNSSFDALVFPAQTITTTSFTVPAANALTNGTYYWRVIAIDRAKNESPVAEAEIRTLHVNILVSPADGSYTLSYKPAFRWNPVKSTDTYTLQITTFGDTAFANPLKDVVPSTCTNQKATSCTLIGNLTPGRYLWRVNVNGAQAPRSWLLIMTPPVPKAPVMGLPLANGFVNDNTPMLTWTDAPSGPATPYTYEVQVDNDSSFASPVLTRSDIGGTYLTVTPALPDGKYYWRVRTLNSYKAPSVWSAARYFTIDIIPPGMPQLTTPETNKIFTTNNRPVLSWKAVPGANRYRVDISTNSTFTAMAVNGATVTTLSYTVPTALALPNGTYYWRIRAIDAAGNIGPAAPIRNFTVAMP